MTFTTPTLKKKLDEIMAEWCKHHNSPDVQLHRDYEVLRLEHYEFHRSRLWKEAVEQTDGTARLKMMVEVRHAELRRKWHDDELDDEPDLKRLKTELDESDARELRGGDCFFVTVNPAEVTTLKAFVTLTQKFCARKIIKSAQYVYEQRSDTVAKMGYGKHVHMLIRTPVHTRVSDMTRNVYSTFKTIVGNQHHCDVKVCKPCDVIKRLKYMQGLKQGEAKLKKVLIDPIWRETNDLLAWYGPADDTLIIEQMRSLEVK